MAAPTLSTPAVTNGTAGTGTVQDTGVVLGAGATFVLVMTTDNGNVGTTVTFDPGGGDEIITSTPAWARQAISGGANVAGFIIDVSAVGAGTYTVQADTTESTKTISIAVSVVSGASTTTDDLDATDYNVTNGTPSGETLTSGGSDRLMVGMLYCRENRTVTLGGDLDTTDMSATSAYNGFITVATGAITSSGSKSLTYTLSGATGFYSMGLMLAPSVGAADPEGPLVGGKLVGRGILGGRLVA